MSAPSTVAVDVLHVGDVTAPKAWVFQPRSRPILTGIREMLRPRGNVIQLPLLAFLLHHPVQGTILVDTGLHRRAIENLRSDYGLLNGAFFRTLRPAGGSFDQQLRERLIDPEEVRLVVMTHLHADHTSGMRLLPNARFICAGTEWSAATKPRSNLSGYVAAHLPPLGRMRLVDLQRDGVPYEGFEKTIDLFDDGSVRLLWTPGHTPGHLSVLLTRATGPVLLIGDAVYTLQSLREQILPLRTEDQVMYRKSMHQLNHYGDMNPDAVLIPTHDAHAWRQLSAHTSTSSIPA